MILLYIHTCSRLHVTYVNVLKIFINMDNVISLLLNKFNAYNLFVLKEISLFITFDFFLSSVI